MGDIQGVVSFVQALMADHASALSDWLAVNQFDAHTVAWLRHQGLAPVAFYRLREAGLTAQLPTEVMRVLHTDYLHTVAANMLALAEAEAWARRFAEAGIMAVWLKGVPLSQTIYPHLGLRPMLDIDVLVSRADRSRALALVEEQTGQDAGTLSEDSAMHAVFRVGDHQRISMEVHWSLLDTPSSRIAADVSWFLSQQQTLSVDSSTLLMLKPEAHLLYLCAHAEIAHGEGQMRLLRYLDLHLLLARYPAFDWRLAIDRAIDFGWTYAVERALTISQYYFATPLPGELLAELQTRRPESEDITQVTRRQIPGNRWDGTLHRFTAMSWSARWRLALQLIFPPLAYMRWRYQVKKPWQASLYYPVRWLDVSGEVRGTIRKRLRQLLGSH